MKKLVLALAMLLGAVSAQAQMQTYVTIASGTWRPVFISTGAPTRVDNFNGLFEGLLKGRTEIKFINPTGNPTVYCGYNNSVSSQSLNHQFGEEVLAGDKVVEGLSSTMQFWCIPVAGVTGSTVVVKQVKPMKSPGE